ncbi:uncharacterized, partial [Tachysurus ichikawai]
SVVITVGGWVPWLMSAIDLFRDDLFGLWRKGVPGTADSRPVFLCPSDRLSHALRVY